MNLRALKDEASRLLARGKVRRSMKAYEALIALEPKDPLLRMRHAETARRLGFIDQAVASFKKAASLLEAQGHLARARAALNLALGLEGKPAQPSVPLAFEVVPPGVRPQRAVTLETFQVDLTPAPIEIPAPPSGELVRLSDSSFGFRAGPDEPWVVLRSSAPIHLRSAESDAQLHDAAPSETTH